MKKSGFTLIEILAVITILGILMIVIVPNVSNLLNDSEDNLRKQQISNVISASKQYMVLHSEYLPPEDSSTIVNIGDLIYDGIIENDKAIDPKTKEVLSGCVYVSYSESFKQYEYTYLDECNFLYQSYNFSYTGGEQEFVAQWSGKYKIEVWGASGGNASNTYTGGYGGYSVGTVSLGKDTRLYVNVGGVGSNSSTISVVADGGYNGGGYSSIRTSACESFLAGSGGGATHVATVSGVLSSFDLDEDGEGSTDEISPILIVAGGGGGSGNCNGANHGSGGHAGGYIGNDAYSLASDSAKNGYGTGATQTAGGCISKNGELSLCSTFGQSVVYTGTGSYLGGGGGFYGGGRSALSAAGGGSGYIGNESLTDKAMYCYDCTESNDIETKTVSTTGTSSLKDVTNCPNGVSSNPISKCAKSGNGYVKITYLGI